RVQLRPGRLPRALLEGRQPGRQGLYPPPFAARAREALDERGGPQPRLAQRRQRHRPQPAARDQGLYGQGQAAPWHRDGQARQPHRVAQAAGRRPRRHGLPRRGLCQAHNTVPRQEGALQS
ncbi:hypothetical protein BN1723_018636, partial [Verticillium longisporum]